MTASDPTVRPAPTLRSVALVALVAGAFAGVGAFALAHLAERTTTDPVAASSRPTEPAPDAMPAREPAPIAAASSAELDALRDALVTAEAERSQLAGTLLALNRRAEALETRLAALADVASVGGQGDRGGPGGDAEGALPSGEDGEVIVAGEQGLGLADDAQGQGDETDSLVAAGLDPQSAADIRRRRDEFQLARLELIDQATREGWADSERLGEQLETLEETRPDLRAELGDESYDRYLYEEGGDNRIAVASVIEGSQAFDAGIAAGDVVLSYAGERVFRTRELQSATRAGSRGEYVQISVLRDGEIIAVDVPRGPLGVTLNGLRRPPG